MPKSSTGAFLPSRVPDGMGREKVFFGHVWRGAHLAGRSLLAAEALLLPFLCPVAKSTGSFQKICNARVFFSWGSLKAFCIFSSVSSSVLLLKLWVKAPGLYTADKTVDKMVREGQ